MRLEERYRLDFITMSIYIAVVYGWSIFLHPMGRDYAALAGETEFPWLSQMLWDLEVSVFGGFAAGYHLVNMLLMLACMFSFYVYVNRVLRGPTWVGMLAANLFMANPLHLESLLNLSGSVDLLPAFFAIATLAAYAAHVENANTRNFGILTALTAASIILWPAHAALPAILLLHEGLLTGSQRRSRWRMSLGGIGVIVSIAMYWDVIMGEGWNIGAALGSLVFTAYSIGLLPETAHNIAEQPLLGWAIAGGCVIGLGLIHWKSQHAALPFAIVAMLLTRLVPDARPIDPVHLIGGGQLILAQAFYMLAFAAVYLRIMYHPKWRPPLIYGSVSISVIFFIVTGVCAYRWHTAANMVRDFQARAETLDAGTLVAPDYRYYRGAPLCLSDSVAYDTPFSTKRDLQFALPVNLVGDGYTVDGSAITFNADSRFDLIPLTGPGSDLPTLHDGEKVPVFTIEGAFTHSIPDLQKE